MSDHQDRGQDNLRDGENAPPVAQAEPSKPVHPDEDGWEAALANTGTLQVPTPPPAAAQAPVHDMGSITAPMPPVVPVAPVMPVPVHGSSAVAPPALHLQTHAPNAGPAIIVPQIPDYPRRKPQPLTGPLLSVYGAMLWSFVVAGQFTTSWMSSGPMDERWAAIAVFMATVVTGIVALRRAHGAAPVTAARVVGRGAFAFVGAFVAWFATIFVAALAGNTASRNHDVLIAMALTALAVTASVIGPRLTSPGPHLTPTHGRRVMQVMFWAGLALVTLIAGAELVSNG